MSFQKQFYDKNAGDYDGAFLNPTEIAISRRFAWLISLLPSGESLVAKDVLEIGAGTGNYTAEILKRRPEALCVTDISEEMLKIADERLGDDAVFYWEAPAERLPFPDGSFDVMFACACLHHVADPDQTFKEAYRVLRPGGYFLCMEPNVFFPLNFLMGVFVPVERGNLKSTKGFWRKHAENAGFVFTAGKTAEFFPGWPQCLQPTYQTLNRFFSKIPIVRNCAIMNFLAFQKH